MFNKNELMLISMVMLNRADDVRKILGSKVYANEQEKLEDRRYADDLEAVGTKAYNIAKQMC